jgi:ribosome biogenesis protein BMS1
MCSTVAGFRISLTGTTLELKSTPSVMKKLKLVGTPKKIFKNTAFIGGMFNSALEVAKFEGAKLKTVSGIRGQIKKAVREGDAGTFRATFEDKILMSDIVTCRLWTQVEVKKFYNPVMSLLEADGPESWKGMKTTAELRRLNKVPIPINKDSLYKPVERTARVFKQMSIPKKVEEGLPFASKPKQQRPKKQDSYMSKRAVILEPEDRKKRGLISMLSTIGKEKAHQRANTKAIKSKQNLEKKQRVREKFEPLLKEEKKRKYAMDGKEKAMREGKAKVRRVNAEEEF